MAGVAGIDPTHVATLWELTRDGERLRCAVYRRADGLHLTVESAAAPLVSEPCTLQPRAIARARALRDSLVERGWSAGA
jgi:hypothetical protein